jgi:hypothetical protein
MEMGLDELGFLAIGSDAGAWFVSPAVGEAVLLQADRLMSNVRDITKPIKRYRFIASPHLPVIDKPKDQNKC